MLQRKDYIFPSRLREIKNVVEEIGKYKVECIRYTILVSSFDECNMKKFIEIQDNLCIEVSIS